MITVKEKNDHAKLIFMSAEVATKNFVLVIYKYKKNIEFDQCYLTLDEMSKITSVYRFNCDVLGFMSFVD